MQITNAEDLLNLEDNEFLGELPKLTNSQININGKNNILICEDDVSLWNCRLDFNNDNSIIYLSGNSFDYYFNISCNGNNVCFIGKNNYFNGQLHLILSESKNIFIGNDCMFSHGISVRTADAHLLYNSKTKERINYSKSIYIGDHVWLGQNVIILKGSQIGSGATIGAGSIISNKVIPSNTTFAGSPARLIHEDSFWIGYSVHSWDDETTQKYSKHESDMFIYTPDESTLSFDEIENELNNIKTSDELLNYIEEHLLFSSKNRFSIK